MRVGDSVLAVALVKTAARGAAVDKPIMRRVGERLLLGGATLLGAAGLAGGIYGVTKAVEGVLDQRAKAKAFKRMVQMNPRLQEADQEKIRRIFDAIWYFSPTVGAEPSAAAAFVEKALQFTGTLTPEDVRMLVSIQQGRGSEFGEVLRTTSGLMR